MHFRYTIGKARWLVVGKGSGVLTKNELVAYRQQLGSDPDFDESFWRLIDLTEVTDIQFSSDDISVLAPFNTVCPTSGAPSWPTVALPRPNPQVRSDAAESGTADGADKDVRRLAIREAMARIGNAARPPLDRHC
jgi:hypothetical protein